MKNVSILMILTAFSYCGCSSQKNLNTNPPFSIANPTCQQYAGGLENSGTGFILEIPVSLEEGVEIEFLEVFFRGHVLASEIKKEEESVMIICNYKQTPKDKKPDIIMHSDPKKEVGNQPPNLISKENEDFPFSLKKNEAVISYINTTGNFNNTKVDYYKVEGIKDKPMRVYR